MADVRIDNPIVSSPFDVPTRHFRFDDEGITSEIAEERRASSYFVPIPAAKRQKGQRVANLDQGQPMPEVVGDAIQQIFGPADTV